MLSFGPVAGTLMACPEPAMSQATEFQQALAAVTRFTQSSRQLVLYAADEIVLTFVADVQSLEGTLWSVTLINNGQEAVVGLLPGTEISLNFESEEVNGNAGCNNFFGDVAIDGDSIVVGPLGSTMRFCAEPAGLMEQETAFLAALQSAASFRIEAGELWMRTAEDAIALIATEVALVDLPAPEPATPTGRVSGAQTLNIRSGPGTNFPVIGAASEGDEGTIVGRSADGLWWAFDAPRAPGGVAWASAQFIAATNAESVPVIAAPPTPTPLPPPPPATPTPVQATRVPPTPTPLPPAQISFWADRTTINAGECATLFWDVNNVQAVWVYPQGANFNNFPRTGQGNERVCPPVTTTYEMRVLLRDGTTQFRQVTINVIQPIAPPSPPQVEQPIAPPSPPQVEQPIAPPAPPIIADPLAGTRWVVINFNNGMGAVTGVAEGTSITLDFAINAPNQLSGSSGCNTYFADYSAGGASITIGAPGSTNLVCTEPAGIMEQEQQYLAALRSAVTFSITGDQLQMRSGADALAIIATQAR
jgi:heat shock protein HslJ